MATRPDAFPHIALRHAKSPDVASLFQELARRAEMFARMQDEFTQSIIKHREARERKPIRLSKAQRRTVTDFERDAENAVQEMEQLAAGRDDATLVAWALSGVKDQIRLDEEMLSAWHEDDKPMAQQLLDFQHETQRLIEQFLDTSPECMGQGNGE